MDSQQARTGIVTLSGKQTVPETVARLAQILESKGVKIFAIVDHSGEAEKAGLHMPDTKLIIFGNPKAGTPLMIAAPTIAIDLPLKILIQEDENGRCLISYNDPGYLGARHNLPADLLPVLGAARDLAQQLAG